MKKAKKLTAVLLTAALAIGTLAGGSMVSSAEELNELWTFEVPNRELENLIILNSEMANDLNVLCNTTEGLLETDAKGKLIPGIASEWGTEDGGLTWTFKLREGVKWVDWQGNEKGDVTAQDWITALEWVMNAKKNGANNTSMPTRNFPKRKLTRLTRRNSLRWLVSKLRMTTR